MYICDVLVESILMHGAEIWGWAKYQDIEGVFMKWSLKLDKTTPKYMLRVETGRVKVAYKTRNRSIKI